MKTTLVVGASGIIGGAVLRRFAGRSDRRVVALSRGAPPTDAANITHTPIDLTAPVLDANAAAALGAATEMVYCAFVDASGWRAQRAPNIALMQGALDIAERFCPSLRHIALIQGMKAYGSHLGPFKTPAKESDPRPMQGHFYFDQQDMLSRRADASGWRWTALRPHVVLGAAQRSPQNLVAVIGVYASLMRARGEPLWFPGPEAAFDVVCQATDADLLAAAIEWSAARPEAAGETFNITNGDYFRWRHLWPRLAEAFEMPAAGPKPQRLAETLNQAGQTWRRLVAAHGLQPNELDQLVSWPFADYIFGVAYDVMADTLKCRRAGFLEFADSEDLFVEQLTALRRDKIIP